MCDTNITTQVHIFEHAGLGKAPFTFVRVHDTGCDGGSTCQYCSTPIRYQFYLRSADGKSFFVGSDCINKTEDSRLTSAIEPIVRQHNREVRHANESRWVKVGDSLFFGNTELSAKIREHLKTIVVSKKIDGTINSKLDFLVTTYKFAGNATAAKEVRKVVKDLVKTGVVSEADIPNP